MISEAILRTWKFQDYYEGSWKGTRKKRQMLGSPSASWHTCIRKDFAKKLHVVERGSRSYAHRYWARPATERARAAPHSHSDALAQIYDDDSQSQLETCSLEKRKDIIKTLHHQLDKKNSKMKKRRESHHNLNSDGWPRFSGHYVENDGRCRQYVVTFSRICVFSKWVFRFQNFPFKTTPDYSQPVKRPSVRGIVEKENESLGLVLVRDQETNYIAA